MTIPIDQTELRDIVREKYAAAATVTTTENPSASRCCRAEGAVITDEQRELFGAALYDTDDRDQLPDSAGTCGCRAGSCASRACWITS